MALNVSKPASVRSNGDRGNSHTVQNDRSALTAGAHDRDCLILVELALRRHLVVRDRVLLEPGCRDPHFGKAASTTDEASGGRLAASGPQRRARSYPLPRCGSPSLPRQSGCSASSAALVCRHAPQHVDLGVEAVLVHEVREEQLLVDVAALQSAEQRCRSCTGCARAPAPSRRGRWRLLMEMRLRWIGNLRKRSPPPRLSQAARMNAPRPP